MRTITSAQCRAARALLNWTQPELAQRCDIHVQTISNFEKEASTPSKSTLEKIVSVFIAHGLQLTEGDGVRREQQIITHYEGGEGFRLFMDDIYHTMVKTGGGPMCLLNAKPDFWIKWLGEDWYHNVHVTRMKKIMDTLDFRITIKKGDYNFIASRFAEYRWMPDRIWNQYSYYCYADKIGFMNFSDDNLQIIVLQKREFAETFRFMFDLVWEQHSIIPDDPSYKPRKK